MTDVTVVREIAPSARVAPTAKIGPFCVVGPDVTIGPRTVLTRRVSVTSYTAIGSDNVFENGCVLGSTPQDLKYGGSPTVLIIGHRNWFGRSVTAHVGTELGGYITYIGNDCVFHDGCHIAHDCYVYDRVQLGRGVMLAGHVRIDTGAVMGDSSGVHHFATIGKWSRVGPRTPVRRDVPPYTNYYSVNCGWTPPAVMGMHDAGIAAGTAGVDEQRELRYALGELFEDEAALQTKIEQLVNMGVEGEVADLCEFCQQSLQGIFGRHRELYRGQTPPEAEPLARHELVLRIGRGSS